MEQASSLLGEDATALQALLASSQYAKARTVADFSFGSTSYLAFTSYGANDGAGFDITRRARLATEASHGRLSMHVIATNSNVGYTDLVKACIDATMASRVAQDEAAQYAYQNDDRFICPIEDGRVEMAIETAYPVCEPDSEAGGVR